MKNSQEKSPFKVGEFVIYRPTLHGLAADAMADPDGRLTPGKTYRIVEIQKELYILVEGYHHPLGGIYWTEFCPCEDAK